MVDYPHIKTIRIQKIESHALACQGFNRGNRKRRSWQDGITEAGRQRLVMITKLFKKTTPFNVKEGEQWSPTPSTHPWITAAMQDQQTPVLIPSMDKPGMFELSNRDLVSLDTSNNPSFNRGDVVWTAFKIGFAFLKNDWFPELLPVHFVRVAESLGGPGSATDETGWEERDDEEVLEPCANVSIIEGILSIQSYSLVIKTNLRSKVQNERLNGSSDPAPMMEPCVMNWKIPLPPNDL